MSYHMTEEEQVEAIKAFLKKHHRYILMGFLCLCVAFVSYRYWQWHLEKAQIDASGTYEALMIATAQPDRPKIHAYADRLIQDHAGTVYADVARLLLAKCLLDEGSAKQAEIELSWLAQRAHTDVFKQLAKIRLARVLLESKQYEQALQAIDGLDASVYAPIALELQGDIYLRIGKTAQAKKAYEAAFQLGKTKGMMSPVLEVKMKEV